MEKSIEFVDSAFQELVRQAIDKSDNPVNQVDLTSIHGGKEEKLYTRLRNLLWSATGHLHVLK